jgi:hypothetical protein
MNLTTASRKSHCPACGLDTDTVSVDAPGMEPQPPHSGQLSICRKCGAVCELTDSMDLRELSDSELSGIHDEKPAMYEHIETVRDAIESAKKFRAPKQQAAVR